MAKVKSKKIVSDEDGDSKVLCEALDPPSTVEVELDNRSSKNLDEL